MAKARLPSIRTHIVALGSKRRERCRDVDCGERGGGFFDRSAVGRDCRRQALEDLELEGQRPFGRIGDLGFELAELGGGKAHLAGGGLAVNESRIERGAQELLAMLRRDIDK